MKKVLVMMLMMVLATFASPLFALDESPPCIEKITQTDGQLNVNVNVNVNVGAAHAEDVGFVKITPMHSDTPSYGGGKADNKMMKISGFKQNANINLTRATMAVVCQPRGVIGV